MSTFKEEADYLDMWIERTKKAEARSEAAEAKFAEAEALWMEQSKWLSGLAVAADAKLKALQEAAADAILRIGIGRYRRASEILEAALAQSKE